MYASLTRAQVSLPLTLVNGYGPFRIDKSYINFDSIGKAHPLYGTLASLQYNGLPAYLQSVKKGIIWFDFSQFLYQHVQQGNISRDVYERFCKERGITRPENELSKKPIACYVLAAKGMDAQGKELLLLDTDNDQDFGNESPIAVADYTSDEDYYHLASKAIQIDYQAVFNGTVVTRKMPLVAIRYKNNLFYNIPQYAVATLQLDNVDHEIAVSHEFRFPDFFVADIARLSKEKAPADSIVKKNQFLHVGNHLFKNKGVNYASLTLQLEEVKDSVSGAQKGMLAIPFKGQDAVSGRKISLADYRGKYLFIDFWGTWCSPCVAQLPKLKEIYATLDSSKIAFLGIAGNDDLDRLRKMIAEKGIPWPNILSDDVNRIVEQYSITAYPTGILLDPAGKVVESKIPSVNLEAVLRKYL
jgi:thiol-disulfide isomerase/thioredoxin